jgi:hypothetical protein
MKLKPTLVAFGVFAGLVLFVGVTASPSLLRAQEVTVTSATPDTAEQGTISLDVTIKGSGYKKGARAQWFVTGTTNPGGIIVNSTAFVNSTTLVANITVAADAQTQYKLRYLRHHWRPHRQRHRAVQCDLERQWRQLYDPRDSERLHDCLDLELRQLLGSPAI